jgi:hypothetical protein
MEVCSVSEEGIRELLCAWFEVRLVPRCQEPGTRVKEGKRRASQTGRFETFISEKFSWMICGTRVREDLKDEEAECLEDLLERDGTIGAHVSSSRRLLLHRCDVKPGDISDERILSWSKGLRGQT